MPDDVTPPVGEPTSTVVAPEVVPAVVAPPVETPPAPPAPIATPDIGVAELDSAIRLMEAQVAAGMTTDLRAKEMVLNQIPETAENKAQRDMAVQQLALERQQLQHQLQNVLPQALGQYKATLLKINTDDGVPISLLATAQSEQQLEILRREWVKAYPKTQVKEAVPSGTVVAGGRAGVPPAPAVTPSTEGATPPTPVVVLDSGQTSGGPTDEPWRNMTAKEKIIFGMGLKK